MSSIFCGYPLDLLLSVLPRRIFFLIRAMPLIMCFLTSFSTRRAFFRPHEGNHILVILYRDGCHALITQNKKPVAENKITQVVNDGQSFLLFAHA